MTNCAITQHFNIGIQCWTGTFGVYLRQGLIEQGMQSTWPNSRRSVLVSAVEDNRQNDGTRALRPIAGRKNHEALATCMRTCVGEWAIMRGLRAEEDRFREGRLQMFV